MAAVLITAVMVYLRGTHCANCRDYSRGNASKDLVLQRRRARPVGRSVRSLLRDAVKYSCLHHGLMAEESGLAEKWSR